MNELSLLIILHASMKAENLRFIQWLPRVTNFGIAVFLSLFSLDVFNEGYPALQLIQNLFLHLLPALSMLLILAVSWHRPMAGGVVLPILAVVYAWMSRHNLSAVAAISGPLLATGVLYWLSHRTRTAYRKG